MVRIVVDEALTKQFRDLAVPCEVFDAAGNRLGMFRPDAEAADYEGYECPLSNEELDRIEREGGGRPLTEILRDLEGRQ